MSIDTRDKRASVIGFALAFRLLAPTPDGSLAVVGDRMQVAGSYRGIAPAAPVAALDLLISDTRLVVDNGASSLTVANGATAMVCSGATQLVSADGSTSLLPD